MKHLLVCLALGLLAAADAPKDGLKQDKEKLQGTWKAVTAQERGETRDDAEDRLLIFSGDEFRVKKGDDIIVKGKFKIDASKRPKEIDMEITDARKDDLNGKTALGIYELEGNTLKWCASEPGGMERPKEFSSNAENKHILATLKREKSKQSRPGQGAYR
jgi:uncharacterized protein (TIGR03067 family)